MQNEQPYFEEFHEGGKPENKFMMSVVNAINRTPENARSAMQTLEKYFDVQSLIDVIAMNTVVGATDDWRIRHNFFFYVYQNTDKKTNIMEKKLIMLPWDYDRLNDAKAEDRLTGLKWYETPSRWSEEAKSCKAPLVDPAQMAYQASQGNMATFEHMKMIWTLLPRDYSRKIHCDKITKLFALALPKHVHARVMELTEGSAAMRKIKKHMAHIGSQITKAQLSSEDKVFLLFFSVPFFFFLLFHS